MPETLAGVALLIVFILPGFVLAQASGRAKLYKPRSDLEFVVRSLVFSLVIHAAFLWWAADIYGDLRARADSINRTRIAEVQSAPTGSVDATAAYRPHVSAFDVWTDESDEIFPYAILTVALIPIALGSALGRRLQALEKLGKPPWWGDLLGAAEPPRAWDALASQLGRGGWVVVRLRESGRVIGGRFGTSSLVNFGKEADLLLEELWWVDEYGQPVSPIEPRRGAWFSRDQIESLVVIRSGGTGPES